MKKMWPVYDQGLWYLKRQAQSPCREDMHVQVAIVGGGMAGLSAAQAFVQQGKKVVLFEQYFCGAGASGKSSGFITQNAELSLTDFTKRYNVDVANQIWKFIGSGVADIRRNILENKFNCGYIEQDSLLVASTAADVATLQTEYQDLQKFGYKSSWYDSQQLREHVGTAGYFGGVAYHDTFGIDAYAYCQEMKKLVESQGVLIFEETPVTQISDHTITTRHSTITADYIVVCTDRFMPELNLLSQDVYHAQNFIIASQQLTEEQIRSIFPQEQWMVWDTELIYNYFRMTADQRLIVGGGDIWTIYNGQQNHDYGAMVKKLTNSFAQKFPHLDIQFEYLWSGLIGLSKDIAPLAGRDKNFNHIFYIAASAGLPIAAALGRYSAENLLQNSRELDDYFSPYRKFAISGKLQSFLGTKLTFALCNMLQQKI